MLKTRQSSWTNGEDNLLAEVVLRHIRTGSTQLQAFEEVGRHLNRTSAACGFRWNAKVRKDYRVEIQSAKCQRKEKKNTPLMVQEPHTALKELSPVPKFTPNIELDHLVSWLKHLYESAGLNQDFNTPNPKETIQNLKNNILLLKKDNKQLSDNKKQLEKDFLKLQTLLLSVSDSLKQ